MSVQFSDWAIQRAELCILPTKCSHSLGVIATNLQDCGHSNFQCHFGAGHNGGAMFLWSSLKCKTELHCSILSFLPALISTKRHQRQRIQINLVCSQKDIASKTCGLKRQNNCLQNKRKGWLFPYFGQILNAIQMRHLCWNL